MNDSKMQLLLVIAAGVWISGMAMLVIRLTGGSDVFALVSTALSLIAVALYLLWLRLWRRNIKEEVARISASALPDPDEIFVASLVPNSREGHCDRCGVMHRDLRDSIRWHTKRMRWLSNWPATSGIWGVSVAVWYRREKDFVESLEMIKDSQILINHADR